MADQVFIAEFDKNTRHLSAPHRLTLDENENIPFAWTPDSKSAFFASNRTGTWKIFKQPIDQTTAELVVEGTKVFMARLSVDGSAILYLEGYGPENPSIPVSIMRKKLAGGAPQEVLRQTAISNIALENGAVRALVPISNKSQFGALPEETVEKLDVIFYGDVDHAVL